VRGDGGGRGSLAAPPTKGMKGPKGTKGTKARQASNSRQNPSRAGITSNKVGGEATLRVAQSFLGASLVTLATVEIYDRPEARRRASVAK
jgi:hypothetical protein